jgi:acyl carrier protein
MAAESEIHTQIRTALAQHLKKDVAAIQPHLRLREDLGLDSLSTLELLFKLEEAFDMEIPNEDLPRLATVQSVGEYILDRLAAGDGHVPAAPGQLAALASRAVASAAPARPAPPAKAAPAPKPAAPAAKPAALAKAAPAAKAPAVAKRAPAAAAKKPARPAAKPSTRPRA